MAKLLCNHLTLGYDGASLVQNFHFCVNKGDYLCIIGENGAGKTTLMKAILGLLQPMAGEIVWGDGLQPNEIGYLTQQSEVQREFPASVQEIVRSGFQNKLGLRPFYNKAEKAQAAAWMEKLHITHLSKTCYRHLSGGQQQRVLLARALCATEKILFLDEPATGLDPQVSADMYAMVETLNKEHGVTILMISHDLEAALPYASHVLRMGVHPFFGDIATYHKREG